MASPFTEDPCLRKKDDDSLFPRKTSCIGISLYISIIINLNQSGWTSFEDLTF